MTESFLCIISLGFDDSTWASGPSELGYGDTSDGRPEATIVSFEPDPNNKYVTTYFRHTFTVTNAAEFTNLSLRVVRDDGAVVYLNGAEVARFNMPTGAISYLTLAASNVLGPDEARFFAVPLNPALLLNGPNVLAMPAGRVRQWRRQRQGGQEVGGVHSRSPPAAPGSR